jgi:hypothetical protein
MLDTVLVCEKEHVEIEKSSQTLVMLNGTETKPLDKKRLTLKKTKNNKKYNVEFVIVKADLESISKCNFPSSLPSPLKTFLNLSSICFFVICPSVLSGL